MTDLQLYLLSIPFFIIAMLISWRFGERKKRARQREAHEILNKAIEKYAKMPYIESSSINAFDLTPEQQEYSAAQWNVQIAIMKLRNII